MIKEYKAKKDFTSPTLGNVRRGDKVVISEALGAQMVDADVLETKPEPEVAAKETKPAKARAKKAK